MPCLHCLPAGVLPTGSFHMKLSCYQLIYTATLFPPGLPVLSCFYTIIMVFIAREFPFFGERNCYSLRLCVLTVYNLQSLGKNTLTLDYKHSVSSVSQFVRFLLYYCNLIWSGSIQYTEFITCDLISLFAPLFSFSSSTSPVYV